MSKNYEGFKNLSQAINLIVLTFAIITGGFWTLYKFNQLNEVNFKKAELESLENKNRDSPIIKILLEHETLKLNQKLHIIVEAEILNTGNKPVHIESGKSKLIIYKTDNPYLEYSNKKGLDSSKYFQVLEDVQIFSKSDDLCCSSKVKDFEFGRSVKFLLPDASTKINYSFTVKECGLYFIQFITETNKRSNEIMKGIKEKNESTNKNYWIESKIIVVK